MAGGLSGRSTFSAEINVPGSASSKGVGGSYKSPSGAGTPVDEVGGEVGADDEVGDAAFPEPHPP